MNDNPAGLGTRDLKKRIRAVEAVLRAPGSKELIPSAAPRDELSNIIGTPTEGKIEEIEPTLVTEALRKVPQTLTPQEQAQVKANLNISKMELFCDLFNASAGNAGYARMVNGVFDGMLNGLPVTYEEAVRIYSLCAGWCGNVGRNSATAALSRDLGIRTALPIYYGAGDIELVLSGFAHSNYSIEVINFVVNAPNNATNAIDYGFFRCMKLRRIEGVIYLRSTAKLSCAFDWCYALETVKIHSLASNLDLRDCRVLSLESLRFMVDYSRVTNAITITVHPDVYAKLTDEANTEWHQVLIDAAAKNITFATV